MSNHNTVCAGIDTGKHKLDIAFDGSAERLQVDNSSQGHRTLSAWLRQREVERIGIEASGAGGGLVAAGGWLCSCRLSAGAGACLRQVRPATCQE